MRTWIAAAVITTLIVIVLDEFAMWVWQELSPGYKYQMIKTPQPLMGFQQRLQMESLTTEINRFYPER